MANPTVPKPKKRATPQRTPALACLTFAATLNNGELDAATSCFAREGCLITPDATAIRGRESIRDILAQLIARRAEIAVELSATLTAGDVALAHERWRICSEGAENVPFVQVSTPTLVLRCIEEDWKLAIAAPWGVRGTAIQWPSTSG